MTEELQDSIKRVVAGSRDEKDIRAIADALQSQQSELVTGARAVEIDGDANHAIIVTGNHNIVISDQVTELLQAFLAQLSSTQQTKQLNQSQANALSFLKSNYGVRNSASQEGQNLNLKELREQFTIPPILGTQNFGFEVIAVDAYGQKLEQQSFQSRCFIEELGKSFLEMVVIPGGTFSMGSAERKPFSNEIPVRSVTIQPFLMSKHPITKAQWKDIAQLDPINRPLKLQRPGSLNYPVVKISWLEAVEFCERLSQKTGQIYRLPSEAEWEYACRAGTSTPFHFGETITSDLANYDGIIRYCSEPKGKYREALVPTGSFPFANAFGLFEMHGNIWEWCLDHWHDTYDQAPTDGQAWLESFESDNRVMRGGSWCSEPKLCRSTSRTFDQASSKSEKTGSESFAFFNPIS